MYFIKNKKNSKKNLKRHKYYITFLEKMEFNSPFRLNFEYKTTQNQLYLKINAKK